MVGNRCTFETWYTDQDVDGFGDVGAPASLCEAPDGGSFVLNAEDCDDGDATVHPGVLDPCDDRDNDCDNLVDEDPDLGPLYEDRDGDLYGSPDVFQYACEPDFNGWSANSDDCDDTDPNVPSAGIEDYVPGECTDSKDNDCDWLIDSEDPDCQ